MSELEHEIIEKFHQLDRDAQKRVRRLIDQEIEAVEQIDPSSFDYDLWLAEIDAIRITLRPDASGRVPSASELVNEAREERDAEILRSIGRRDSAGDSTD